MENRMTFDQFLELITSYVYEENGDYYKGKGVVYP